MSSPRPPTDDRAAARQNIELKARLDSLSRARRVAAELADQRLPDQQQIDTYFFCRSGRLKLREIRGQPAELIAYQRADDNASRSSRYFLLPVAAAEQTRAALSLTLGVRCQVEKLREIYLHRNVRIHLDVVAGLGEFLEFEAVLARPEEEAESRRLVAELQRRFEIRDTDLIATSYGDLLAAADPPSR